MSTSETNTCMVAILLCRLRKSNGKFLLVPRSLFCEFDNRKMSNTRNAWTKKQVKPVSKQMQQADVKVAGDATVERFKEAHSRNIAAAKKVVENYESSSEEEEELDEKTILTALYKHYNSSDNAAESQSLTKTAGFLENVLHSGAATCLICIGSVRRADAIWSCRYCYCFFHLNCIRRWANDSVAQLKAQAAKQQHDQGYYNHLGEYVPPKPARALHWYCPQCRKDYTPSERPNDYECFCGKELNPAAQAFLVPHSCGEMCGKELQPKCGHKCMLLCHPGPCPPCAQYANTSCRCGKSPAKSVRCFEKQWQCTKKCNRLLPCREHTCNQVCHAAGQCPPCSSSSMQACECGKEKKLRNCSDLKWHCQKACGLKYSCGRHSCRKVCHSDPCGECPLSLPRSCPCGKTKVEGPCTEIIDTCGDTCQKLLPCGIHTCTQRCHRGYCNLCFVITKKKCRCGMHEKELPCSKEFTCDIKCKQLRDCGKHACNRKCCDGNCPPCDKVCGKSLSCNKHKCQSICHEGPCYPCERQSQVNCSCGKTSRNVPCGRERTARIMCLQPCRIPSKCHHATKHRCHKNECPPCSQKCNLPNDTTGCGHACVAKCHAAVRVLKPRNNDPTSKWDSRKMYDYKTLPHPQCEQLVTVTCIGGHETADWPCWNSKPSSCQRKCNRSLRCGNHKCSLVCHTVAEPKNMKEQLGCASCQEGCYVPRPDGCVHPCSRPCHLPPCAPCQANIKAKCHCGLTQVIYKCTEFFSNEGSAEEIAALQERLKSCGNRCLKNFPCGHRCTSTCHPGKCPQPELCRKKVRIYCTCKRLKLEVSCDKHRAGLTLLPCDENCLQTRAREEQVKKQQAEKLRLEEEAKNRLEVEQFEKKFSKRKPKERKVTVENTKREINWKPIGVCVGTVLAIALAIAAALYEERK